MAPNFKKIFIAATVCRSVSLDSTFNALYKMSDVDVCLQRRSLIPEFKFFSTLHSLHMHVVLC